MEPTIWRVCCEKVPSGENLQLMPGFRTELPVSDSVISAGCTWADENVTNRVANCDPVFVPPIFFNLKISRLQNDRNKNGISFLSINNRFITPGCTSQRNRYPKSLKMQIRQKPGPTVHFFWKTTASQICTRSVMHA